MAHTAPPRHNNTLAYTHLAFLGIFLVSALLSLTFATQADTAWMQCYGVVLAVALHGLVWQRRNGSRLWIVFAVLPLVLGLCAVLFTDWQSRLGRYSWLDGLLNWLLLARSVSVGISWNAHAIGGVLAVLLPLQLDALKRAPRMLAVPGILLTVTIVLLSGSRTIWLALVIGIVSYIMLSGLRSLGPKMLNRIWLVGVLLAGVVFFVWLSVQLALTADQPVYNGSRTLLWQSSLTLARDFAFTGIGFGNFPMAYSSYMLLVHVPFLNHAYHLWINLWLSQGALGLIAWCGLLVTALNTQHSDNPWRIPALSSLFVMLVYGLTDDPFYGYGAVMLPLLLLPHALLAPRFRPNLQWSALSKATLSIGKGILLSSAPIALITLLVAVLPGWRAHWHANLGALAQLRTELSVYRWPDYVLQDQLRISPKIDLTPAIQEYETALRLDANNPTANERLGQIELARTLLPAARQHMSAALVSAPDRRAVQQMMGELYALDGQPASAVALWRKLDVQQDQLTIREAWYRNVLRAGSLADRIADASKNINTH